jgi:hypothetical protein
VTISAGIPSCTAQANAIEGSIVAISSSSSSRLIARMTAHVIYSALLVRQMPNAKCQIHLQEREERSIDKGKHAFSSSSLAVQVCQTQELLQQTADKNSLSICRFYVNWKKVEISTNV